MPQEEAPDWWCRHCGQPVRIDGGDDKPIRLRKAVHAATGLERGLPEGHLAAPIDFEPPLWKAAREITAETGGLLDISARFGFLRADWKLRPGVVAGHFEAGTEQEMRQKLRRALIAAGLGMGTAILLGDAADR
jgi:hypothetical protein